MIADLMLASASVPVNPVRGGGVLFAVTFCSICVLWVLNHWRKGK